MDNDKVLLGTSMKFPGDIDPEEMETFEEDALNTYAMLEIIDSIHTEDFKLKFAFHITEIKALPVPIQAQFCRDILEKIKEEYGYKHNLEMDFTSKEQLWEIYSLVQFIEDDCADFLSDVWWELGRRDFKNFFISRYCEQNKDKVVHTADLVSVGQVVYVNKSITYFLRVFDQDNFIQWISEKSEYLKTEIGLNLIQRQMEETSDG